MSEQMPKWQQNLFDAICQQLAVPPSLLEGGNCASTVAGLRRQAVYETAEDARLALSLALASMALPPPLPPRRLVVDEKTGCLIEE